MHAPYPRVPFTQFAKRPVFALTRTFACTRVLVVHCDPLYFASKSESGEHRHRARVHRYTLYSTASCSRGPASQEIEPSHTTVIRLTSTNNSGGVRVRVLHIPHPTSMHELIIGGIPENQGGRQLSTFARLQQQERVGTRGLSTRTEC